MTGLQAAIAAGALVALGAVLLATRLLPVHVDLGEALGRLTPTRSGRHDAREAGGTSSGTERLGAWALRTLPPTVWVRTPVRELALLRISLVRFYGEKVTFALLGLAIPPFLAAFFGLLGFELPFAMPALGSVALAAVMFFIPDYNAATSARRARAEFRRALTAYVDLVALERAAGSGVRQAMENAASVADTWVFTRLAEELSRSRWSGLPPWDALASLAVELGLPDLDDVADILRLSGTEGAAVYSTLRSRAASMRTAILTDDLATANSVGERMSIPGSLLGVVFMALLIAPALLRMLGPA